MKKTRVLRAARRALASSRGKDAIRRASLLAAVVVGVGLLSFLGTTSTEARQYSAYSDPEKTALSLILSREENVREFREAFGLNDGEVEKALAAVRKENEVLAEEYAESERLVEASEALPEEKIRGRIAASDYDETVRGAVARTKTRVRALLPADRRAALGAWVDEQWRQEVRESQEMDVVATRAASSTAVVCKVYATQYVGYTNYEVALPHRRIKFDGGYRVRIARRYEGGPRVWAPVKEVGPWNTYDNYWQSYQYRSTWKSLGRCNPEAEHAYFDNYNGGKDETGREVLNPAGVDLTPAVARELGLGQGENAWVNVYYPWV